MSKPIVLIAAVALLASQTTEATTICGGYLGNCPGDNVYTPQKRWEDANKLSKFEEEEAATIVRPIRRIPIGRTDDWKITPPPQRKDDYKGVDPGFNMDMGLFFKNNPKLFKPLDEEEWGGEMYGEVNGGSGRPTDWKVGGKITFDEDNNNNNRVKFGWCPRSYPDPDCKEAEKKYPCPRSYIDPDCEEDRKKYLLSLRNNNNNNKTRQNKSRVLKQLRQQTKRF